MGIIRLIGILITVGGVADGRRHKHDKPHFLSLDEERDIRAHVAARRARRKRSLHQPR